MLDVHFVGTAYNFMGGGGRKRNIMQVAYAMHADPVGAILAPQATPASVAAARTIIKSLPKGKLAHVRQCVAAIEQLHAGRGPLKARCARAAAALGRVRRARALPPALIKGYAHAVAKICVAASSFRPGPGSVIEHTTAPAPARPPLVNIPLVPQAHPLPLLQSTRTPTKKGRLSFKMPIHRLVSSMVSSQKSKPFISKKKVDAGRAQLKEARAQAAAKAEQEALENEAAKAVAAKAEQEALEERQQLQAAEKKAAKAAAEKAEKEALKQKQQLQAAEKETAKAAAAKAEQEALENEAAKAATAAKAEQEALKNETAKAAAAKAEQEALEEERQRSEAAVTTNPLPIAAESVIAPGTPTTNKTRAPPQAPPYPVRVKGLPTKTRIQQAVSRRREAQAAQSQELQPRVHVPLKAPPKPPPYPLEMLEKRQAQVTKKQAEENARLADAQAKEDTAAAKAMQEALDKEKRLAVAEKARAAAKVAKEALKLERMLKSAQKVTEFKNYVEGQRKAREAEEARIVQEAVNEAMRKPREEFARFRKQRAALQREGLEDEPRQMDRMKMPPRLRAIFDKQAAAEPDIDKDGDVVMADAVGAWVNVAQGTSPASGSMPLALKNKGNRQQFTDVLKIVGGSRAFAGTATDMLLLLQKVASVAVEYGMVAWGLPLGRAVLAGADKAGMLGGFVARSMFDHIQLAAHAFSNHSRAAQNNIMALAGLAPVVVGAVGSTASTLGEVAMDILGEVEGVIANAATVQRPV